MQFQTRQQIKLEELAVVKKREIAIICILFRDGKIFHANKADLAPVLVFSGVRQNAL
jgi:hypothetical protein